MDEFMNNVPENNEDTAEKVMPEPEVNKTEQPTSMESGDNFFSVKDFEKPESDNEAENTQESPLNDAEVQPEPSFQEEFEKAEERELPEEGFNNPPPILNPIRFSDVNPVDDYKPMSRGLKFFALIMAAIVLLTGSCLTGYFIGKNSIKTGTFYSDKVSVDLASRPKDTDEMTEAQVYEAVNKSIVGIIVYNTSGKSTQASGIVYSEDGYIVTNDHIYSEVSAPKFKIYTYDGTEYDAEYVAGDVISDLAVLKVNSAKLEPAEFGDSSELFHGEHVVAVGRPSDATDASSITRGIISAVNRRVKTTSSYTSKLIQTDSAINPGSSGGALLNMYGQVIGVTSSKLASVEYDAVGYAIPTVTMKRIVEELISNGKVVSRAKLGVTYNVIDSVTAEINNYDYVGLYIATISEDSDLYGKADEGDIITHINGKEVTSDAVVLDIIDQSSAGDKITVTIVTASGQTKNIEAVLKANVGESSYIATESLQDGEENDSSQNGGTFDFPFGE